VIHRIWLGSPLPAEAAELGECWQARFPDYRLELWTDGRLAALGMPPHFYRARTFAERADIARYLLLRRFGGIYADCDAEPLRRFDDLWTDDGSDFVAFHESPELVWNGLIAAAPGHRVLRYAGALAARSARRHAPEAAPNVRTGPFVFTAAVDYAVSAGVGGMRVLPVDFVHVRGERSADAVVSSPFRDPPSWAGSDPLPVVRRSPGRALGEAVERVATEVSLAAVRARRTRGRRRAA
jgi:hypothetical protein